MLREDLRQAIDTWLENEEEIVVCVDANEDVRTGPFATMMKDMGLQDIIISRHKHMSPPPATHARNEHDTPIDAIYSTIDIPEDTDIKCGFLAFGDGLPGDHRCLWVDFPYQIIFGYNPPHLAGVNVPRLIVQDPRARRHYHREVISAYTDENIFDKATELRRLVSQREQHDKIQALHKELLIATRRIRLRAAKICRKKKTGAIPWSPEFQKLMDTRTLWTLVVKKKKRVRMSSRKIRRLMKITGIPDAFQVSLDEAVQTSQCSTPRI